MNCETQWWNEQLTFLLYLIHRVTLLLLITSEASKDCEQTSPSRALWNLFGYAKSKNLDKIITGVSAFLKCKIYGADLANKTLFYKKPGNLPTKMIVFSTVAFARNYIVIHMNFLPASPWLNNLKPQDLNRLKKFYWGDHFLAWHHCGKNDLSFLLFNDISLWTNFSHRNCKDIIKT